MIPSTSETQLRHVFLAASWPPKSQALNLILPITSYSAYGCWVGSICFMTSYLSLRSRVVFPASSRPKKTILAFLFINPRLSSVDLNQLKIHMSFLNKIKIITPHVIIQKGVFQSFFDKFNKFLISLTKTNKLINKNMCYKLSKQICLLQTFKINRCIIQKNEKFRFFTNYSNKIINEKTSIYNMSARNEYESKHKQSTEPKTTSELLKLIKRNDDIFEKLKDHLMQQLHSYQTAFSRSNNKYTEIRDFDHFEKSCRDFTQSGKEFINKLCEIKNNCAKIIKNLPEQEKLTATEAHNSFDMFVDQQVDQTLEYKIRTVEYEPEAHRPFQNQLFQFQND